VRPCFEVAAAKKKGQPAAAPQPASGLEAMSKSQAKATASSKKAEETKDEPFIDDDIPF
jgi:hypothetical protein